MSLANVVIKLAGMRPSLWFGSHPGSTFENEKGIDKERTFL
jgi:hypothetical protein